MLLSAVLLAAGCSGGGSSLSPALGGGVSGTAATGDPITNAAITLVDSAGKNATGTTGTDGSFTLAKASGLTPPFMLKVTTTSGKDLYSVSADANSTTTVNVTPLTDMIVRTWYSAQGASIDTAFLNPASNPPPSPTDVKVISTVVKDIVQSALQAAGVDISTFNPISTTFKANGSGVDGVIHNTAVTVNPTTGVISLALTTSGGTQNSTITPAAGALSTSTTSTTSSGTSSATTSGTAVPTSAAEADAFNSINTEITNFLNMVNSKGSSLAASDIAAYVDPNYLDNGLNASQWETKMASQLAGKTLSFAGLNILSMNSTNTVAETAFQVSMTSGGTTTTQNVHVYFKLISGSWLMSGDGDIANAYVTTWAWDHSLTGNGCSGTACYVNSIRFEVDDPETTPQVASVTVSGPNLSGAVNVPAVCDNTGALSSTNCGTSYGDGTQRAFQIPDQAYAWWPAIGAQYTFTLTTSSGSTKTVTATVDATHGFDASMNPIYADYPVMSISGGAPSLAAVLTGVTVKGSVFVPIWAPMDNDAPHFNYEGDSGQSSSVGNQVIKGTWDAGTAVPGQTNNFTIVVPAATNVTTTSCSGGGTCYNITFQGQTGVVQGGWFGADACDNNRRNGGSSCTNSGVEVH